MKIVSLILRKTQVGVGITNDLAGSMPAIAVIYKHLPVSREKNRQSLDVQISWMISTVSSPL